VASERFVSALGGDILERRHQDSGLRLRSLGFGAPMALGFVSLGFVILPSPFKTLRLQALGCGIQVRVSFRVQGIGLGSKVQDLGMRFGIQGLGSRV